MLSCKSQQNRQTTNSLIKNKGEKPQISTIKLDREGGNREIEEFVTHEAVFAAAQQM